MITKKLKRSNDVLLELNEEEMVALNINQDDKFSLVPQLDGSIKLEKYVNLELDMADWSREILEMLIKHSCEQDVSVNEIIISLLEKHILENI